MNFLDLCNETARLCEITGTLTDTQNPASDEHANVVRWTQDAWLGIQGLHSDWEFLRKRLSFNTVVDQSEYTPAQMSAADIAFIDPRRMSIYELALGVTDRQIMTEWTEIDLEDTYQFSSTTSQRPMAFALRRSDRSLVIGPAPDKVYAINGWYWSTSVQLSASDEEPAIDSDCHMIIPYRAAMKYANRESAPELKVEAIEGFNEIISVMRRRYLPQIIY